MKTYRRGFKWIGAVCAVMLMIAMLAACGGNNASEEPGSGTETNSGTANELNEGKDGGEPAVNLADLKGEVKLLTVWGGMYTEHFAKVFEDFNKDYPNIKVTFMEQTTADLAALIAAGEIPDVISSNALAADLRKDSMIEDLTPYLNKSPDITPELYYEPAYKRSVDSTGAVWALPVSVDPNFALAINNDVLEQYGFTELPEINSLQELGDFLKKFWVTENGEQVMTTFAPNEIYGGNNSLITMAYLNGADASNYFNEAENKVTYNDPVIVEALQWIVDFKRENIDDERMAKLHSTLPENTGRLLAGKSLMEPHVTPLLWGFLELNPDLTIAPMPMESLWIGGWSFSLTTAGKKENKEAAWALLKWMTSSKAGAESFQKHLGWISGIKDNPYLEAKAETDPVIAFALQVLKNTPKLPPYIPVDNAKEFDTKWAEVMAGTLEPKAFLDHMTTFTQALLDEQKK
ncbi:extracellular solute-binding protein [Paenibacillus spongiae]|uniref:Extracellular solute-binding protein n=1 Tax=Paenibacillus spongiae TaxID=2909671 RepID=A0ABY5S700_9BACL|nr:extracellular solute-binding protein [Paenibacillus spongiae]UVI29691.1 extracellular solute-binding protein [Paenibacillus spongiae]